MKANDLAEMEQRVQKLLQEETARDEKRKLMLLEIKESIQKRKALLDRLESERKQRINTIEEKRKAAEMAKAGITEIENTERAKRKEELEKEYADAIYAVNTLRLDLSKDMSGTIEKIMEIQKKADQYGFHNLSEAIREYLLKHMQTFSVEIKSLGDKLRIDKAIDLAKGVVRGLKMISNSYASVDARKIFFSGVYFDTLYEEFGNHFLSDLQTNRLDKPEWYLEHLLKQIHQHKKIFSIISQIEEVSYDSAEEEEKQSEILKQEYFTELIGKIVHVIVQSKFLETLYSSSRQRKKLLLHHSQAIGRFFSEIASKYSYEKRFSLSLEDKNTLQTIFVKDATIELERIISKTYSEWSNSFRYLLKQVFSESVALFPLLPEIQDILISSTARKYLSGVSVFLNSFTYRKQEEELILVQFIEDVLSLEEELVDIENDLCVAVQRIVLLDSTYFLPFKTTFISLYKEIMSERLCRTLKPFVSYRFMEEHDEAEALSDLSADITHFLSQSQATALVQLYKKELPSIIDLYLSKYVIQEQIDGITDLDRIKNILSQIIDMLKDVNITFSFPLSYEKCQKITLALEKEMQ